MGDNPLVELPYSIGNLRNIKWLFINNCKLTNLPESISNLQSLTILNITGNSFSEFPEGILKLKKLDKLRLNPEFSKKEINLLKAELQNTRIFFE